MLHKRNPLSVLAVVAAVLCVQACGIEDGSIMDELELPTFGGDSGAGERELEVPPDLDPPESKGAHDVASAREVSGAASANRVLPRHLDMRLRSEGGVVWLAVSATPDGLWPHLVNFWESHGFEIVEKSMLHGRMQTGWREQKMNAAADFRIRDMFRMRVERAPNAVTNVYLVNRKSTFASGDWQLAFSDRETEIDILQDLQDYLASRREVGSVDMPPLENVRIALDIRDLDGAPALIIGQPYNHAWRRLGVTLDRAGLDVRRVDRSRGVYLIRHRLTEMDAGGAAGPRLLQVRVLLRGDKTVVTVRANRKRDAALTYEAAHEVLNRIVRAYEVRA